MKRIVAAVFIAAAIPAAAMNVFAQSPSPVRLLDIPYIQQSEALCGGAAAAMVMRYWGATDVRAETFEETRRLEGEEATVGALAERTSFAPVRQIKVALSEIATRKCTSGNGGRGWGIPVSGWGI